jgi:hypothetical protein
LGIAGFVSPPAHKPLTLAGASWSFDRAAQHLAELCGLHACGQAIRAVCYEEAGRMADRLHADKAAGAGFAAASGDIELQTDGPMVNTWEGWREMRRGVFAERQRGQPAPAERWGARRLPAPGARVLFGGSETAEHFGPRLRRWAGRLGIRAPSAVTVLAGGAEWIWNQAAAQLPGAAGLLDIYRAGEHLSACGRKLYGEGTAEARTWLEEARAALVAGGWPALAERTGALRRGGGRRRSAVPWTSWGVLLPPAGAAGLRGAAGGGSGYRQRAGGGFVQAGDRPADEADGGAVAGAAGEPPGNAVLHAARRYLEALPGATPRLTARFRDYTPAHLRTRMSRK